MLITISAHVNCIDTNIKLNKAKPKILLIINIPTFYKIPMLLGYIYTDHKQSFDRLQVYCCRKA